MITQRPITQQSNRNSSKQFETYIYVLFFLINFIQRSSAKPVYVRNCVLPSRSWSLLVASVFGNDLETLFSVVTSGGTEISHGRLCETRVSGISQERRWTRKYLMQMEDNSRFKKLARSISTSVRHAHLSDEHDNGRVGVIVEHTRV